MAVLDPEKRKRLLATIAAEKPKVFDPFDPSTPIPPSYYDESLKDADKARSDFASSLTPTPDLSTYGSGGAAELTGISEGERKNLLASAATNQKAPMQNLMQPSQEFQQQMKGREVALRRAAGDGLGAQAAMQDPNYVLGSGSSLRKKPEPLAPDWARMNRASRRLKRQGYLAQAGQMASLAELERLGTPNLMTQDQRNRMTFMGMERDAKEEEQRRQADLYDMYLRKRQQQELDSMS